MAPTEGIPARSLGIGGSAEVVEIGLLLPTSWANGLIEMSRRRNQSVGQLIRSLIDRALVDDGALRT